MEGGVTMKAKAKFSRWDAADYLRSEADMASYLEAVLEEAPDDAALFAAALGNIARARGMVQLAKDTGISREGLYKALAPDGNPSLSTVLKVVRALHLKLTPQAAEEERPQARPASSSRKRKADCPA
jgi:probable addiction module antidote protein